MTLEQFQRKWFRVNLKYHGIGNIKEFELLWSSCTYFDTQVMKHCAANELVGIVVFVTR